MLIGRKQLLVLLALGACACHRSSTSTAATGSASVASSSPPALGLSVEDSKLVLARVGDVAITLGDYAATLGRMDRFERLRYQSAERRQQLLQEIINVELLAQEAKRQKLDQDPEVRLRLDEALREEVLRDLRDQVPSPEALPAEEVRGYYESHRTEFKEPERRRVSAIVLSSEASAKGLLDEARASDATKWGQLVRKHSVVRNASDSNPLELEGDLGIVSASGQPQGTGPKFSDPLLHAVFEIPEVGGTYPHVVQDGSRYYILRMTGRTEARERSFSEAERSIRVLMVEQRLAAAEQTLLESIRKQLSVTVDEKALAAVRVPAATRRDELKDALAH
jgi:parvulin-like peptidyl-prolyl isomerase